VTIDEERVDRGGWVAMTLQRYWGLENCRSLSVVETFFVYNAFLNFKPVQRFQNLARTGGRGPGSCNNDTSKRTLDMPKAI